MQNLGHIFEHWFTKSILSTSGMRFSDHEIYQKALQDFEYDYRRYYPDAENITLEGILAWAPLQSVLTYRIARQYFLSGDEHSASLYSNLGRFLSGIEIFFSAEIGRGMKINHGVGTVIGARSIIGENALIHQNVTLGDRNGGRPQVGNNVVIYAGAKILGKITIGDNAVIAANAVVIGDVPQGSTAVGIPARIITK